MSEIVNTGRLVGSVRVRVMVSSESASAWSTRPLSCRGDARAIIPKKEHAIATITVEEAQAHLPELIGKLQPGEEIVIARDSQPVAKLTGQTQMERAPRRPGTLKGTVLYMGADFNAPLEEFKEYMP